MRRKPYLSLSLVVILAAACAAPKIGYDYDPHTNFSAYRTYDWVPGQQEATGDRRVDNAQVDIRIRTAVGAQLHLKGYAPTVDGKPDFYVAYHVGLKDLTADTSTQYFSEGMAGHAFAHSADSRTMGQEPAPGTRIDPHLTGSLLVDIVDAASRKLVWRGTAAGEINPGLTSEERNERVRTIVREMLSHFPPK
jgi:hypothetical protein